MSTDLTPARLEELLAAATPGPWRMGWAGIYGHGEQYVAEAVFEPSWGDDAALIALTPSLAARVIELEAALRAAAIDALAATGLAIIDTRTHVAVAREPSEADVERVFCVLAWGTPERPPELADDEQIARAMAGNCALVRTARAAIAAMTEAKP